MTSRSSWNWSRLWRLAQKELRETLRDRRTVVTLVLMPILLYPVLGIGLRRLMVLEALRGPGQAAVEYIIAFSSANDAGRFLEVFRRGEELQSLDRGVPLEPGHKPAGSQADPQIRLLAPDTVEGAANVDELIANHSADIGIVLTSRQNPGASSSNALLPTDPDPAAPDQTGPGHTVHDQATPAELTFEIAYDDNSIHSREAKLFVETRLQRALLGSVAAQTQSPVALPFQVASRAVESPVVRSVSLSALVPLILILMTVTGAVYPAIDLTAGERERGTLEALIAAPISRQQLLIAKYCAVVCVALLTALANLVAMTVTMYGLGLETLLFGEHGLTWSATALVLVLLIVFAGFFSAVILALTSLARSFKEAQAYLIPLMLVSLAPGMLSLMPSLQLTPLLAITPLANIVLLSRDIFSGSVPLLEMVLAIGSTCAYAAVALQVAARIFGTDALLYGSEGTWADFFQRRTELAQPPSVASAWLAIAGLLPAFVISAGLAGRLGDLSISTRLLINAGVTIALFAGVPLALAWWQRSGWQAGLASRPPRVMALIACVLLGLSLWPWAFELERLILSTDRIRELEPLLKTLQADLDRIPLWLKLVTLSIVPAVCEELFFRGYLISTWRNQWPNWVIVLASGGLFGAFHVLLRDTLFFERFVPTAALGCLLAWICLKTGSVWPGILLHVVHNGLLLSLSDQLEALQQAGVGTSDATHLPASWLLASLLPLVSGFALLIWLPRHSRSPVVAEIQS